MFLHMHWLKIAKISKNLVENKKIFCFLNYYLNFEVYDFPSIRSALLSGQHHPLAITKQFTIRSVFSETAKYATFIFLG
ncbi:hypothetical protein CEN45_13960 [Fischerella thermalis CCMEE 5198]|nr:hypothetical protein CEN45_13960 [Fischerella thermalis CCMEE 5198]